LARSKTPEYIEAVKKSSKKRVGQKRSEETKQRMREAWKNRKIKEECCKNE